MEQRTILVQDIADETLTELCFSFQLGRGRMLQVTFEHALNTVVLGPDAPTLQSVVDRVKTERTVPECVQELLELAKIRSEKKL